MTKQKDFNSLCRECFDTYKKSINGYLEYFADELQSCEEDRAEEIIYYLKKAATCISDCSYPDEDNFKDADLYFEDAEELAFEISEEWGELDD